MISAQVANYVVLAMVFIAVVLAVLALAPAILGGRTGIKDRLAAQGGGAALDSSPDTIRTDSNNSAWARLLAEIESRGLSLTDEASDKIADKLALAGFEQPYAQRAFTLARAAGTLTLPSLALLFMSITGQWPTVTKLYMILLCSVFAGLYLPGLIVNSRAGDRAKVILDGFPDTLDLLLVCLEAGLGIDAAFNRVGTEVVKSHPMLARLFGNVSLELRAGRSREAALRTLARKSGVPEITAFTTLIIQSDKLGASVAQSLRIYAAEMRESRRMRAEEKAHRIPVLLSLPLVCFLLPTMIAVLMLPAGINMKNQMAQID